MKCNHALIAIKQQSQLILMTRSSRFDIHSTGKESRPVNILLEHHNALSIGYCSTRLML